MEWQDRYMLGHAPMDATHQEFVALVNTLAAASDTDAPAALEALYQHTEAHFAQENRWMADCGFPPIECHVGEHERVLAALRQSLAQAQQGNAGVGRVVAGEMPAWFDNHAATMDAALAWYMRQVDYQPECLPQPTAAAA